MNTETSWRAAPGTAQAWMKFFPVRLFWIMEKNLFLVRLGAIERAQLGSRRLKADMQL
jgi:hypothetical protein